MILTGHYCQLAGWHKAITKQSDVNSHCCINPAFIASSPENSLFTTSFTPRRWHCLYSELTLHVCDCVRWPCSLLTIRHRGLFFYISVTVHSYKQLNQLALHLDDWVTWVFLWLGSIWLTWGEYSCACCVCRRIYLAYMDSVHFFKPRQFRTAVYHEILIGYLDYVKLLGYVIMLLHLAVSSFNGSLTL